MIKLDVQKSIQYKYIKYKFMCKRLENEALQNLSEDDKEKILIKTTKKTRKITWIIIMLYIPVMIYFTFGFVCNYRYVDNAALIIQTMPLFITIMITVNKILKNEIYSIDA